jgi:hypothetical protein
LKDFALINSKNPDHLYKRLLGFHLKRVVDVLDVVEILN